MWVRKLFFLTGVRTPNCAACSESLYRICIDPSSPFTLSNVPCFFFFCPKYYDIFAAERKNHGGRRFTADDWYQRTQNCISRGRKRWNISRTIRKISGTAVHLNVDGSYHRWKQIKQNTRTIVLFLPNPHTQHKITMFNKFRTILFLLYSVRNFTLRRKRS